MGDAELSASSPNLLCAGPISRRAARSLLYVCELFVRDWGELHKGTNNATLGEYRRRSGGKLLGSEHSGDWAERR